jgi:hypothetical protein
MDDNGYIGINTGEPNLETLASNFLWTCHKFNIFLPDEYDKKIIAESCYYGSMRSVSKLYERKGKLWDALERLASCVF